MTVANKPGVRNVGTMHTALFTKAEPSGEAFRVIDLLVDRDGTGVMLVHEFIGPDDDDKQSRAFTFPADVTGQLLTAFGA